MPGAFLQRLDVWRRHGDAGPHLRGPITHHDRVGAADPDRNGADLLGDLLLADETAPLDLSCFRAIVSGGSAVPSSMIEAVRDRWNVPVIQGWGMTETSPMCVLSHPPKDLNGEPRPIGD